MSWKLSPEDLIDQAYLPSLWRIHAMISRWLVDAIIGAIPLDILLNANHNVHRRLANSRRKRKPQICYPLRH
jgi:hypothetical protein